MMSTIHSFVGTACILERFSHRGHAPCSIASVSGIANIMYVKKILKLWQYRKLPQTPCLPLPGFHGTPCQSSSELG